LREAFQATDAEALDGLGELAGIDDLFLARSVTVGPVALSIAAGGAAIAVGAVL